MNSKDDLAKRELETLGAGKFLHLVRDGRWEFVRRTNTTGVVAIIPVTDDGKIVLVEQFRAAVRTNVIELPAGLVGDIPGEEHEALAIAAERELVEETGYEARTMWLVANGPPSAGMSDEVVAIYLATGLTKVHAGGGDATENIVVHEIPLHEVAAWLEAAAERGGLIDPKVYVGLYFAGRAAQFS